MKLKEQVLLQRKQLEEIVASVLSYAKNYSDEIEVTINQSTGVGVSTRFGETESIEFNNDVILHITVYHKRCKGSISSTNLHPKMIKRMVKTAIEIAKYTSEDSCSGLADIKLLSYQSPDLKLFYPFDINIDKSIKLASQAEIYALNADKRIKNSEGSKFNSHYGIKVFGNSYGMLQSYCFSTHTMSICVIAQDNNSMERDYSYTIARKLKDLASPKCIGREAAKRAISRLSPCKLPTMKTPVIFTAEVATSLFSHLISAISGINIYRKSSFLSNSMGKKIFPNWLTIKEDPHVIGGLASSPFDNEGVKTNKCNIIKEGILQTWLLNTYSSRKLGLQTNGHAGGIYNWYINNQGVNFDDLLKEMDTGLVITELLGYGVNLVTGDYSRGAVGFWIEHGRIKYPVSEITIASNLKEMWSNIITIGNDIETRGNIQCGSVFLSAIQVAGQ
ncbi:peptidase PmbA [Candidatus Arsenophonus lipoptenae]|uniref:Peptidase PmbA n=1 Tax=Candidatus Arsenophonus lipoptenae TaxID=634113 RepID=A0A0X9VMP2_9GAMM|nr:metalloprotease PmbA [Candidatus Arsenophonus lipoptenae]AMA65001.1 peptidase PmbA [Candidatus Arsenophonus lipoptenae]